MLFVFNYIVPKVAKSRTYDFSERNLNATEKKQQYSRG